MTFFHGQAGGRKGVDLFPQTAKITKCAILITLYLHPCIYGNTVDEYSLDAQKNKLHKHAEY